MAELLATVRAVQKIAAAWVTAAAVVSFDDKAVDSVLAVFAGILAHMATCQCIATIFQAQVLVAGHILAAFDLDFMAAPRNRTGNNLMTNDLVLCIVEPAWERSLDVTARQFNSDVWDNRHTF
jgi:hypothetical protein